MTTIEACGLDWCDGDAVAHDSWHDGRPFCVAHGGSAFIRRLAESSSGLDRGGPLPDVGLALSCSCRPHVLEAELGGLLGKIRGLCVAAIDELVVEQVRWRDGERQNYLGTLLAVTAIDARGLSRFLELAGSTSPERT